MSNLATVTRRLQREVGLSGEEAKRIANKLNRLAESVPWATPVTKRVLRVSRSGVFTSRPSTGRATVNGSAKRKSAKKVLKKR